MRPVIPMNCFYQRVGTGLLFLFSLLLSGCNSQPSQSEEIGASAAPRSEIAVRRFCGDCHAFPEPDTYPAHVWPEKVREGFKFYYSSLRTDLAVPAVDAVEQYYAKHAPEELTIDLTQRPVKESTESQFASAETRFFAQPFRAIAHLRALSPRNKPARLLAADMRNGCVWDLDLATKNAEPSLMIRCLNACRIEPTDLDQDGAEDYVLADLGSFLPEDHSSGAVWFVRRDKPTNEWTKTALAEEIGRVVDVRPLDADNDGDTDLIVAEFGWRSTGKIFLLRNNPTPDGSPRMTMEVVDDRHGAIHVPVADLNNDGNPDFVALISQEHETVVAFLNRGDGTFDQQTIFQSSNPGFGSCGIELVDMDDDGDFDVAFVNGDSLDTPIAKPYHSVSWFENEGVYPFTVHEICKLPGGYCVKPGDIDDDGDIDLAVVALLPGQVQSAHAAGTFDSVMWFEQLDDKQFIAHSLERDNCQHAACELIDWDADGDLDLVVADMAVNATAERPLTIFRNLAIQNAE